MIFNYIKIALRNLTKQKLYSVINISGLAAGLAVCMMILLYVAHENSYDNFHKNSKRIVALHYRVVMNGNAMNREFMSYATGQTIKESMPVVEGYTQYFKYFLPVSVNDASAPQAKFNEDNLLFADAGFFSFFSFKLLSGQPADVLDKPFSVVISADMAKKYFGNENPIGKTLTIKTESIYNYQVTGVAENAPSNSSINIQFVASAISLQHIKSPFPFLAGPKLGQGFFNVFLLLKHTADTANVAKGLLAMVKKDQMLSQMKTSFSVPLLTDLHFKNNNGDVSNVKYLKIFPLVAVLILLLALVNYMSLSTARSTLRAKEVGIRKMSGASRKSLALQFYIETAIFTFLSFILGYILCYLCKPWFLNMLQLKIDDSFLYGGTALVLLAALLIFTVLIAGSYPALVLSSFKPVATLKGKMSKQTGGVTIRKIFTTLQFTISVGLLICGIIIDRQMYYFRHNDTSVTRENIAMISVPGDFGKKYQSFKKDISTLAGVSDVATSNYSLFGMYDTFTFKGKTKDENVPLLAQQVDNNFIPFLGLQWKFAPVAGTQLAGKGKLVINEAAIDKLHLTANPVGTFVQSLNSDAKPQVEGVLKNFNFKSMQYAIEPFGLFVVPDSASWPMPGCTLYAKIKPHINLPSLLNKMQGIYKKYDQDTPFNYTFMDDAFNAQYKAEDRLASIFSVFTFITIILATLGLFGLAAFTIEQRTKEIGIRKVLGASLASINTLLSRDFLALVVLSIVIASPIAWWAMHGWLQGFAYRINISWWMFAAAGFVAIITAIVTVSYHAIKAGIANPVESLRSE